MAMNDTLKYIIYSTDCATNWTSILAHSNTEDGVKMEIKAYVSVALQEVREMSLSDLYKTGDKVPCGDGQNIFTNKRVSKDKELYCKESRAFLPYDVDPNDSLVDSDEALKLLELGEYMIIYDPNLDVDDTFGDIECINMVRQLLPEEKTSKDNDLEIVHYWGIQKASCILKEFRRMETGLSLMLKQDQEANWDYYNKDDHTDPTLQ
jgi:hypothetical protein